MTQTIDIEEIKQKMFKRLEPSGWHRPLKSFIFSSDFENIIKQLVRLSKDGQRFTPKLSQILEHLKNARLMNLRL